MKLSLAAAFAIAFLGLAEVSFAETWGGRGIRLVVVNDAPASVQDNATAILEFDCASAQAAPWKVKKGKAIAPGTYTAGTGVQLPPGQEHETYPAAFEAKISKNKMTLQIYGVEGLEDEVFTLKKGEEPILHKCMASPPRRDQAPADPQNP
jgi:hypothetical protein